MKMFKYINYNCMLPISQGSGGGTVSIDNFADFPLGIEQGIASIGCTKDVNGNVTGRVFAKATSQEDEATPSVITLFHIDTSGVITDPFVGTWEDCSDSSFFKICTRCLTDDVNSDGLNLVQYVEAYLIDLAGGTLASTLLGTYTDECLHTPYTIQGTPVDPNAVGTAAVFKSGRIELTDAFIWSPPSTTLSYTVVVEALGAGITFEDSNNVITNLRAGRAETWSHEDFLSDNAPIITGSLGAIITINYTEIA